MRSISLLVTCALLILVFPDTGAAQKSTWSKAADMGGLGESFAAADGLVKALPGMLKDYGPLTKEDETLDPDYDPPGQPDLPSLCVGSKECAKCFGEPQDKLQLTRYRFEKLRLIYSSTKNMTERSIAFGDAAASGVGIGGLAWVKERQKIEEAVKNLQSSYDNKYAELIDELYDALQGIGACEEEVFGEQSWYDRFGFMYYEFMAARYLRAD